VVLKLQYGGGEPNAALNLVECQEACIKKPTCVGVDWSPDELPTRRLCYLLEQSAYYGFYALANGLIHLDLTRTSPCDGTQESTSNRTLEVTNELNLIYSATRLHDYSS
jgi:hypothetical protein